jgi:hypothetical protein
MNSKELNFEYCESNVIEKIIENNKKKKIETLYWSERDSDIVANINFIFKNNCDIILSEILPSELPHCIFKSEYDYICERLIFIPPFKEIQFTDTSQDKGFCILYDDYNIKPKKYDYAYRIIRDEFDSIKVNNLKDFIEYYPRIASYKRIIILLSNPVLSNLISYNLNLINRNHIIESSSIKSNIRYTITGLSNYLHAKMEETSVREKIKCLLFDKVIQRNKNVNFSKYKKFFLSTEFKVLYLNKILLSYENKSGNEPLISNVNEFSVNFIINLLLTDFFIESVQKEIISEEFYVYKIISYIFNDERSERRIYYINQILQINSVDVCHYLLCFCRDTSNKHVHVFFARLLTELSLRNTTSVSTRKKSAQLAQLLITEHSKKNAESIIKFKYTKLLLESIPNDNFNPITFILENNPKQNTGRDAASKREIFNFDRTLHLMLQNINISFIDLEKLKKADVIDSQNVLHILKNKVALSGKNILTIHENDIKSNSLKEIVEILDHDSSFFSELQSPLLESVYLKSHPELFSIERFKKYNLEKKLLISLIAKFAGENSIFDKCASHLLNIFNTEEDKFSYNLILFLKTNKYEVSPETLTKDVDLSPQQAHECISITLIIFESNLPAHEHLVRELCNKFWYFENLLKLSKEKFLF